MTKEELEKELDYINQVIKTLKPNDGDTSFYYWQKWEIEKQLKECEKNDRENESKTSDK